MTTPKSILVATIGTRDLMFQVGSGFWYNVGDDRMQDEDIIGEQAEVISDLSLEPISYRNLTDFLRQVDSITERIKPAIIGKIFLEKLAQIEQIYLIATNQNLTVKEREKDTLYAAELIKDWLAKKLNFSEESVQIILLGEDGTNPSNFEEMFRWWRKVWKEKIIVKPQQPIWVCLKGGVGQASEASRISGLSLHGDRIQFFEFKQNTKANRAGIPSDYTGPFLGKNYLWDRVQQQALKLFNRFDYDGVLELLEQPYFQSNPASWSAVPTWVKAGVHWHQGEFKTFFNLAKSSLTTAEQNQANSWWWMAYEQAQLAVIRLKQQNTTEAMLHSYRAVEGLLYLWAAATFPKEVKEIPDKYPDLTSSIIQKYDKLESHFFKGDKSSESLNKISLKGRVLRDLLEAAIPQSRNSSAFDAFWNSAREMRNNLSHRLGGLPDKKVFQAWGKDVKNSEQWQAVILECLNVIAGQQFKSLSQASLFIKIHNKIRDAIASYQP